MSPSPRIRPSEVATVICLVLLGIALWWLIADGGAPPASLRSIRSHLDRGQFEIGQKLLADRLNAVPNDPETRLFAAEWELSGDSPDPSRVLDLLEHPDLDREDYEAASRIARGKAYYELSRYPEAEQQWRKALDATATEEAVIEVRLLLFNLYFLQGRIEEARVQGQWLLEMDRDPDDRRKNLIALAMLDIETVSPTRLIEHFQPVLERNPDDLGALVRYWHASIDAYGDNVDLTPLFQAKAKFGDRLSYWVGVSQALLMQNDLERLAAWFEADVPEPFRDRDELAEVRGRLAQRRHDYETALREYEIAIRQAPNDSEGRLRLRYASLCRLLGRELPDLSDVQRYRQARVVLRRDYIGEPFLKNRNPDAFQNHVHGRYFTVDELQAIGRLREEMGRLPEALAWHRLVLDIEPENLESRNAITRLQPLCQRSSETPSSL